MGLQRFELYVAMLPMGEEGLVLISTWGQRLLMTTMRSRNVLLTFGGSDMKLARKQPQINMHRVKQHGAEAAAMDLISTQMQYRRLLQQTIIIINFSRDIITTGPTPYRCAWWSNYMYSCLEQGQRPFVCWQ